MKKVVGLIVLVMGSLAAHGQQAWNADTLTWQESYPDGTKFAMLEGDRSAAGKPFSFAFFIPKGYWEHHWHSAEARVAVLKGTLKVSFGDQLDKEHAKAYPVGSFLIVPANMPHTMGADEDTVFVTTAIGPWSTHHHDNHEHGLHSH